MQSCDGRVVPGGGQLMLVLLCRLSAWIWQDVSIKLECVDVASKKSAAWESSLQTSLVTSATAGGGENK